jgi:hypothetical protein
MRLQTSRGQLQCENNQLPFLDGCKGVRARRIRKDMRDLRPMI